MSGSKSMRDACRRLTLGRTACVPKKTCDFANHPLLIQILKRMMLTSNKGESGCVPRYRAEPGTGVIPKQRGPT